MIDRRFLHESHCKIKPSHVRNSSIVSSLQRRSLPKRCSSCRAYLLVSRTIKRYKRSVKNNSKKSIAFLSVAHQREYRSEESDFRSKLVLPRQMIRPHYFLHHFHRGQINWHLPRCQILVRGLHVQRTKAAFHPGGGGGTPL